MKIARKNLERVQVELIPELMKEIGLESFTLATGEKVEAKAKITASIKVADREKAHAWLRDNGFGSLIKNEVTASFGKGEEDVARGLVDELTGREFVVDRKEAVHAQTLGAFVREQLEKGSKIPMDLLGVFDVTKAKITRKRKGGNDD